MRKILTTLSLVSVLQCTAFGMNIPEFQNISYEYAVFNNVADPFKSVIVNDSESKKELFPEIINRCNAFYDQVILHDTCASDKRLADCLNDFCTQDWDVLDSKLATSTTTAVPIKDLRDLIKKHYAEIQELRTLSKKNEEEINERKLCFRAKLVNALHVLAVKEGPKKSETEIENTVEQCANVLFTQDWNVLDKQFATNPLVDNFRQLMKDNRPELNELMEFIKVKNEPQVLFKNKLQQDLRVVFNSAPINDLIDFINCYYTKIINGHKIIYKEAAIAMFGAGMLNYVNNKSNIIKHLPTGEFNDWFDAGQKIANYIHNNPSNTLRFEISKSKLLEMLEKVEIQSGPVYEKLKDPSYTLEKVFSPVSFLEFVHNTKQDILDAEIGNPVLANILRSQGNILMNTNTAARITQFRQSDTLGYRAADQKLPMVSNIISNPLTAPLTPIEMTQIMESCTAKFLYENPEATIEDAFNASVKIAQGFCANSTFPDPFKEFTIDQKLQIINDLKAVNARDLCQVGRFKEQVIAMNSTIDIVRQLKVNNQNVISPAPIYGLLPDFDTMSQANKQLALAGTPVSVPYKLVALTRVNVGGCDGKYNNCCGAFATLFNSKQEAFNMVVANSLGKNPVFAQSKFIDSKKFADLNTNNPFASFFGLYNKTVLSNTLDTYQDIVINSPDHSYAWLFDMQQRPGHLLEPQQSANFTLDTTIHPVTTDPEAIERARPLYWFLSGEHYQALPEKGDFIAFSKLQKHFGW